MLVRENFSWWLWCLSTHTCWRQLAQKMIVDIATHSTYTNSKKHPLPPARKNSTSNPFIIFVTFYNVGSCRQGAQHSPTPTTPPPQNKWVCLDFNPQLTIVPLSSMFVAELMSLESSSPDDGLWLHKSSTSVLVEEEELVVILSSTLGEQLVSIASTLSFFLLASILSTAKVWNLHNCNWLAKDDNY